MKNVPKITHKHIHTVEGWVEDGMNWRTCNDVNLVKLFFSAAAVLLMLLQKDLCHKYAYMPSIFYYSHSLSTFSLYTWYLHTTAMMMRLFLALLFFTFGDEKKIELFFCSHCADCTWIHTLPFHTAWMSKKIRGGWEIEWSEWKGCR